MGSPWGTDVSRASCRRDLLIGLILTFTQTTIVHTNAMTTAVYSGTLQSKKKAELKEIASALHISESGTREDLQQRIRKHLDDNQTSLEHNLVFSGLFKRKKGLQPLSNGSVPLHLLLSSSSFLHRHSAASPASESAEEILEKKLASPSSIRSTRRNLAPVETPAPDAREVSMMLKSAPISPPEEETPSAPPAHTPLKERSILFTSTPRSILRNIPKPSLELADTTFKTMQTGVTQHARVYLLASRSVCRV